MTIYRNGRESGLVAALKEDARHTIEDIKHVGDEALDCLETAIFVPLAVGYCAVALPVLLYRTVSETLGEGRLESLRRQYVLERRLGD